MSMVPRFLILLGLLLPALADESAPRPLENEVEELRMVVRTLRADNARLRDRNEALISEVIRLRRMLTQPEPESDPAPTPLPESTNDEELAAFPDPAEAADAEDEDQATEPVLGMDILYVNPTWHYLIVEAGTEDDVHEGDTARILRDGAEIGTARVSAVKTGQSVADIDLDSLGDRGQYPRPGDRLLFLPLP